ncbi:MAG: iron ABC transporter permease [Peptococcaceae bacterium]|jgi:iron complex transport system permease protein|nr:iron ABC transporter permease [Peptococcaceae bacterium]
MKANVATLGSKKKLSKLKLLLLISMPFILALAALTIGRYPVSLTHLWAALTNGFLLAEVEVPAAVRTVIFDIRIPRIIAAILIGMALSVSGAAFQGTFRNPLVSPDILGVSAGAGFGATLAIINSWGSLGIAASAFGFGLLAVWLTYFLSNRIKNSGEITLIMVLGGILVGTIFTSLVSLIKCVADPYEKLPAITYWLMGSLSSIQMNDVYLVILPMIIGLIPLWLLRWKLNLLAFGDEEAKSLGVNTERLRLIVIFCATLLTASAVAISGMIGWVGLVIPHFARSIAGPNYRNLLPVTILVGGSFLLVVDTLARSLLPMEIPLGILTSLIGAPFFLYLLSHSRRGWK